MKERPEIETAMSVEQLDCLLVELTLQHARCIETFGSLIGTIRSFSSIEGSIEDTMRVSRGDSAHEVSAMRSFVVVFSAGSKREEGRKVWRRGVVEVGVRG